jgi:predicted DCC family thiol-disulfide oxidoreductase YuxK
VTQPVIVFDAMCVLCSRHAQFVLRHDRAGHFLLASMQSEAGAAIYSSCGIDPTDPDTVILVEGGRALRDSDAILAIWRGLGWPWRITGAFRIVPRALRDPVYRWVARHRYRLFGRRETCWVPSAAQRGRIL